MAGHRRGILLVSSCGASILTVYRVPESTVAALAGFAPSVPKLHVSHRN